MDLNTKDILKEYRAKFSKENIRVDKKVISDLVNNSLNESSKRYEVLPSPRTMSKNQFIRHWIIESLERYFVSKTLKKTSPISTDPLIKAFNNFFEVFTPKLQDEIANKLSDEKSLERRKEVWLNQKLPIAEIENRFAALIIARNNAAKTSGFGSFMLQALDQHKTSDKDYRKFQQNINKVITYCQNNLPKIDLPVDFYSEFNQPCYLCEINFPPISYPDGVIEFVSKKYPLLTKYRNNFHVVNSDKTNTKYQKETDKFEVKINQKYNNRHKTVYLIHELGHVVSQIEEFQKNLDPLETGRYTEEKKATEIEIPLLKDFSSDVYHAYLGDALLQIHRTLFELSIYENPNQNLGQLYARLFNKCFPSTNQKDNPLYLLDKRIILRPLSSLPQTVALVNTIASLS